MKTLLASAAALGLMATAAPSLAQTTMDRTDTRTGMQDRMMTPEDRAMYDRLPADRRMSYDRFDQPTRDYYRTLPADRADAFFTLNDQQRTQLMALTPEQRDRAWTAMMQNRNSMAQGNMNQGTMAQGNMNQGTMAAGNVRFVSNAVVQQAPAPHRGEYPICESDRQDNCMNAWEAGRRGPGVDRPLGYWPGRPASSM